MPGLPGHASRLMKLVVTGANGLVGSRLCALLSKKGQTTLATASELPSIRADVEGENTMAGLAKQYGSSLRPIAINAQLATYFDQTKRVEFLKQWQQAIKRQ